MNSPPRAVVVAAVALACAAGAPAASASTFTVTKTDDTADGSCDSDCSLREAIMAANTSPGADTIVVPAGDYRLSITGAGEDVGATGDLDVNDDTTIAGAGARTTAVDARPDGQPNPVDRVFEIGPVNPSANVTISHLTIQGGSATGMGADFGGGIENWATLTL